MVAHFAVNALKPRARRFVKSVATFPSTLIDSARSSPKIRTSSAALRRPLKPITRMVVTTAATFPSTPCCSTRSPGSRRTAVQVPVWELKKENLAQGQVESNVALDLGRARRGRAENGKGQGQYSRQNEPASSGGNGRGGHVTTRPAFRPSVFFRGGEATSR